MKIKKYEFGQMISMAAILGKNLFKIFSWTSRPIVMKLGM